MTADPLSASKREGKITSRVTFPDLDRLVRLGVCAYRAIA